MTASETEAHSAKSAEMRGGGHLVAFSRDGDWHAGYDDGFSGRPRESTRPYYRSGYDRGLTDFLKTVQSEREGK